MRRIATLILFLATLSVPVSAQLTDYPLGARTDDASLIVVAEVLASESYWSADHVRLLTRHQLQVETVHKGEPLERIELVTLGGTVGDHRQVVEPSLQLQSGDRGLFFLQRRRPTPDEPERWIAVGGPHGWVRFDPLTGAASDPFNRFADMQRELFEPIAQRTGMSAIRPPLTWCLAVTRGSRKSTR